MKRIEFIAPVAAIRGNMSGNQVLQYAENDNPAYESPKGQRNYARNYRPSFVGAKVSSSGKVYFAVKTKTAVHLTNKALKAMALQGGTGALVGALLANKDKTPYQQTYAAWLAAIAAGQRVTFRKFASAFIREGLATGAQNIAITVGSASVSFLNPWFNGEPTTGAEVSQDVLVKFWTQLHPDGIEFTVGGDKGIATVNNDFDTLVDEEHQNVLSLSLAEVGANKYVKRGSGWLKYNGEYVHDIDDIVANGAYDIAATAPSA